MWVVRVHILLENDWMQVALLTTLHGVEAKGLTGWILPTTLTKVKV